MFLKGGRGQIYHCSRSKEWNAGGELTVAAQRLALAFQVSLSELS